MQCDHCGATAHGSLAGFPIIIHKDNCPSNPKEFKFKDVEIVLVPLPSKRYWCRGCGASWDRPGEAQHALDCPGNPLTN